MKTLFSSLILLSIMTVQAQDLPYYEIPEAPKEFTAGTVASRMVDGLGFRYYWATGGLTEKDLQYKPSEEARNVFDTLDHILVLSIMTLSAVDGTEMDFPKEDSLSFAEMRKLTLENFKKASNILRKSTDLSKLVMKIQRRSGTEEYPFWNNINGPIEDAVWHTGQVVSFRRSAGNPLPKGPSFLTGKVKK